MIFAKKEPNLRQLGAFEFIDENGGPTRRSTSEVRRQIAANRRSVVTLKPLERGPVLFLALRAAKRRTSRNAYRHGLTLPDSKPSTSKTAR